MAVATKLASVSGDRTTDAGSRVEQWAVVTNSRKAAYEAEGIPERGSPHWDEEDLRLDRFADDCDGVNTTITAYYSSDGRFKGPPTRLQKREGWYKSSPVRGKKTTIDIPINTLALEEISNTGPNGENLSRWAELWRIATWKAPLTLRLHRLETYVKVLDEAFLNLHVSMIDHIHIVQGEQRQFVGMTDAREEGDGFWTLVYEWVGDPGTPWPTPRSTAKSVILSPSNRPVNERLLRLPFEEFTPTRSDDPENIPVDILGIIGPATFASEWRQLPGMPPL